MPELSNHLISGSDYLAKYPGFKLIGRTEELRKLSSILVRKRANSVLLVGPAGVGTTALTLGLQALKLDPNAPFDIVEKRLYWLDTDSLFSDPTTTRADFDRLMRHLATTPDSVLLIEDTRDFIDAARVSNNAHFINAITAAVKTQKTQVILETRDQDLEAVLKWHSDIRESYTLMDLPEPSREFLPAIIDGIAEGLTAHHRIRISQGARDTALALTTKYPTDENLSRAQPDRTVSLLDRALSSYRLQAHKGTPRITALEASLKGASDADRPSIQAELTAAVRDWATKQEQIKALYRSQREGEKAILNLETERANVVAEETEAQRKLEEAKANGTYVEPERTGQIRGFAAAFKSMGESPKVAEISEKIRLFQGEIKKNKDRFEAITAEINADLELVAADVTAEFSRITGISSDKLNEDDKAILRRMDDDLKAFVFGQDDPIRRVSNAIKVAKVGKRNGAKPVASFLFMGPSGVGKTEVAKRLALSLLGDIKALTRFDMSEYMEKHSVAKLIGAPPGYELAEAGGILTNAMRKNRRRVILFDEIEKAHPDVFNILLQVLDDGRLTDNLGRLAEFDEAIIICTTNVGQPHYLNKEIPFDEAHALSMQDLADQYRPEFLNRFAGRENIIGFNRLGLDSIERIVRREIVSLDRAYHDKGIRTLFDDTNLKAFCEQRYDPVMGARGLPGIIQSGLEPMIVDRILSGQDTHGTLEVRYDPSRRSFAAEFQMAA
jgi:ATP-dependent Clp protease ATP-binding subunit ClpB